jgi:hypothetical protein
MEFCHRSQAVPGHAMIMTAFGLFYDVVAQLLQVFSEREMSLWPAYVSALIKSPFSAFLRVPLVSSVA